LKPLALGKAGPDLYDELKGIVLKALWPDFITADEVFSILKSSKYPNLIGSYYVFISHYLMVGLKDEHLPVALKWVEGYRPIREMQNLFDDIINDIIRRAAMQLNSPSLIDSFASAAASLLMHDHRLINPNEGTFCIYNDGIRHEIVLKMLPKLVEAKTYLGFLRDFDMPLILSKDIPWMIECINNEKSEPLQRAWASLINMIFGPNTAIKYLDIVLTACKGNPILASTLSNVLDPIDLSSPKAKEMKERYQKRQIDFENFGNPVPLAPPPKERISANLDAFFSGNFNAWYGVTMDLTLEPCSTHYINALESDLTITPGWKAADMQTKDRILSAAKLFLEEQDPEMSGLIGTNTLSYKAISGFKALRLLMHEEPEYLSAMPYCSWKKWSSAIITYPITPSIEDTKIQRELFKLAYKSAPEEMIRDLGIIIDRENKEFGKIFILSKFEDCWDTRLANFIIYKVKDQSLKLTGFVDLLKPLLEHNIKEIRSFTDSYIISPPPTFGEDRTMAIALSCILMSYSLDAGWSKIWPAFRSDYKFGKDVILAIQNSVGLRSAGIEFRLMENQLTDLYLWLAKQYPYSEDPDEMSGHFVTPREEIGKWRDSILDQLKKKGTFEACEGLNRIVAKLPDVELAKMMLTKALKNYYNNSWKPVEADHILELIKDSEKRLVESGDQLIEVLIESLEKLEKKLHDETPAVRDIWDLVDRKKGLYRPIHEEELSDYINRHLYDDIGKRGIILGRNVRIHGGDDETDIHVDAIKERDNFYGPPISVIIEVKGCWNRGLRTAMKLQLMDRYLKNNRCNHGIYLIGWFNCDRWDRADRNYKQSPKISIEDARKKYSDNAKELSDSTIHIKAFVLDASL